MADEKPLTKSGLVAALKEAGVATKDDVRQIVDKAVKTDVFKLVSEATDAILKGVDKLHAGHEKRFDKLEAGQLELKRQIRDLKHDTPSKQSFDDLKARVDKYCRYRLKSQEARACLDK